MMARRNRQVDRGGAGAAGQHHGRRAVCLSSGMAHPIMFDETDPLLGRLRALALALPDAAEKISHGHPAFFTTKIFAYYGGSVKVDGVYQQHEHSVLVLIDPGGPDPDAAALRVRNDEAPR